MFPLVEVCKQRTEFNLDGTRWAALSARQLQIGLLFVACSLASIVNASAQITNVTNDQSVPTPDAGHDYIGAVNETVNPSNGSLSVRIPIPVPSGRGFSLPLGFSYNSSGIIQLGALVDSQPAGGNGNGTEYIGTVNVHGNMDHGLLEQGGWSLGLPWLSSEQINDAGNNTFGATCPISTGFVFSDSAATRHAMYLAFPNYSQCQSAGGAVSGYPVNMYPGAYDGSYAAWTNNASNSGTNDVQSMPFFVSSNDGTLYHFPNLFPTAPGGCAATSVTLDCNVPDYIEDRNGNEVHINSSSGSTNPLPINVIDTGGRSEISIPTFESSTGDQLSISGFSKPYVVNWETISYNFTISASNPTPTQNCATVGAQSSSGTMLVVQSIQLPNGQSYQFQYDPNYGLLNKIIYPTGAYVQYTWGASQQPSDSIVYPQTTLNSVAATGCIATYSAPVILSRMVSFDGQTTDQTQSFIYGTTGFSSTQTGQWTGKTTAVTTTDGVRNESFQRAYSYTPMAVSITPDTVSSVAAQAPVESTITYQDFTGSTLMTVTKYWTGSGNNPLLQEDDTTLNGLTAGTAYQYDTYTNIVEKAEFDYTTSAPPYYNASSKMYTVAPTRTTDTTYQSFPGRTAFYPAEPVPGAPIYDRACKGITYFGDNHGTRYAETDTAYDGGAVACQTPGGAGGASVANIVSYNDSGTVELTHDEANFGSGSSASRGNATAITRWLNIGTSPQTTFTYDETGQMLTSIAPCSAGCSDMSGSNFTTQYSYADNYGGGTPSGNTNAYLTKITDPLQHTRNFSYSYPSGKILSSTDNNGAVTGYSYNTQATQCGTTDLLDRLTEIDYPDQGVTSYCYNDAVPSMTTNQKLNSSTWKTSTTTMDKLGHVIGTELMDPAGPDYTGTVYDGMERVYEVYNPSRCNPLTQMSCGSETTWGATTYTYDSLGRRKSQTNPDNGSINSVESWIYNANTVTFQDESSNQWQRTTDGLGRLTKVLEPNGTVSAASMETDYMYDVNDNLTNVNQLGGPAGTTGGVVRNFNYDSLSRLICASNPESATNPQAPGSTAAVPCPTSVSSTYTVGTLGYMYDVNGNVQSREDARGVVTSYGYDALNRLLSKSYNALGNTPPVSYVYDTGVLGITSGNYMGRLAQVETGTGSSVLYNYSTLGYDAVGRPLGYLECPGVSNCTSGASTTLGASYVFDLAGETTQTTSQGTLVAGGNTVGVVNQRNFTYDQAGHVLTVTADARAIGGTDGGPVTLLSSPSYDAAGQLTAASLATDPLTQQSMIGLGRTYDSRLRPLSEVDAGQVITGDAAASTVVTISGTEKNIGGSGTPSPATGTITFERGFLPGDGVGERERKLGYAGGTNRVKASNTCPGYDSGPL
jgi:YD repeat-containing protein